MVWNPESTLVWNPESRRLESGIQRVEIQNPDAGIQNLEAGTRNPGPSWILLHRARDSKRKTPKRRKGSLTLAVENLTSMFVSGSDFECV